MTKIVLLGTGTPRPDPKRFGPSTAIVINEEAYLVDCGPGVVRRASAAALRGVNALEITRLTKAFLTHLHSDHTVGLPDLIFSTWTMGRQKSLEIYGPKGTEAMVFHILKAYEVDIDIRTRGMEEINQVYLTVNAHEISSGIIYKDINVTVTAFPVKHGHVAEAYGFRFDTPDRAIVISGDTSPNENLIRHAQDCDVLIHECGSNSTFNRVSPKWQNYRRHYHTSSKELAEIANKTRPGLIILYHHSNPGGKHLKIPESILLEEIREYYDGPVVIGNDLDVY